MQLLITVIIYNYYYRLICNSNVNKFITGVNFTNDALSLFYSVFKMNFSIYYSYSMHWQYLDLSHFIHWHIMGAQVPIATKHLTWLMINYGMMLCDSKMGFHICVVESLIALTLMSDTCREFIDHL